MKLLAKSEIDKARNQTKQQDIQEGLKIAKRVDSLREAHANEEASLEKFRRESVSRINSEIVEKTSARDSLIKEVSDLQEQRKKALIPLDAEWQKLRQNQEEVQSREEEVKHSDADLKVRHEDLDKVAREIENDKQRIAEEKARSQKLLKEADDDRQKALHALAEAEKERQSALGFKQVTEQHLAKETEATISREAAVALREKAQDKREKELNEREIRLVDREQTLLRNIKRDGRRP